MGLLGILCRVRTAVARLPPYCCCEGVVARGAELVAMDAGLVTKDADLVAKGEPTETSLPGVDNPVVWLLFTGLLLLSADVSTTSPFFSSALSVRVITSSRKFPMWVNRCESITCSVGHLSALGVTSP